MNKGECRKAKQKGQENKCPSMMNLKIKIHEYFKETHE